jgi:dihydrofolate reductase
MMRKIISFMHVSLDGFVAGPNGEMDWIKINEEIFNHLGKRISKGDMALYGRVTYEMMEGYWPTAGDSPTATKFEQEHSKWYGGIQKVVLSKTMEGAELSNTTIISGNLADQINELKQSGNEGSDEVLPFGSPTATHSLMKLNLIDGYWLLINPIVLGQGIPLFADIKDKIKLQLVSTQPFECGVTELSYTVDHG